MSAFRSVSTAVSYITGEIRLDYTPPHGFNLEPLVDVDEVPSRIAPLEGGTATAWLYLALVKAGSHKVKVTLGNVSTSQEVQLDAGRIAHLDFFFVEKGA